MANNVQNNTETRREDWETPKWLFSFLSDIAGFDFAIDIAATERNALCKAWLGVEHDASSMTRQQFIEAGEAAGFDIEKRWAWCNPPYGKNGMGKWTNTLSKFVPNIVALVPGSVGTKWFRPLWETASCIVLLGRRLKFGAAKSGAQFESALYVRGNILTLAQIEKLRTIGTVIESSAVRLWKGDAAWRSVGNI